MRTASTLYISFLCVFDSIVLAGAKPRAPRLNDVRRMDSS